MRLISTEPEFSWTGTAMILGLTGVCGLVLALSLAAGAAELYRPVGSGEAAVAQEELAVDPFTTR
jgi:hypothetical protein